MHLYFSGNQILADALIVLILAVFCFVGYRRGLFRSVMTVVIVAASVFAAFTVSDWLAPLATEKMYPYFEEQVKKTITEIKSKEDPASSGEETGSTEESAAQSGSTLPAFFGMRLMAAETEQAAEEAASSGLDIDLSGLDASAKETLNNALELMKKMGFSKEKLQNIVDELSGKGGEDSDSQLDSMIGGLSKQVFQVIVRGIIFLIVFLLTSLILKILTRGLNNLIFKIPVIGTLNHLGGMLLQLAAAILLLSAAAWVVQRIPSLAEPLGNIKSGTFLLRLLIDKNPIILLLNR